MGIEIERKFLVDQKKFKAENKTAGKIYIQGYLSKDPARTVRVRITPDGSFITIKGLTTGMSRAEFEYEIPRTDAAEMLNYLCTASLSKIRYEEVVQGKLWVIDEFLDENAGLMVAEIELEAEDEIFELPKWLGREVTTEQKSYNSNLAQFPYSQWTNKPQAETK